MSKGDRDARVLQDVTGARYTTCLARVRSLRALADGRAHLDSFMAGVDALPDLINGQLRCVTCLHDLTPIKKCVCL
jgi:hypothetical protein